MTSRDDVTGGESLRTCTRWPLSISVGVSGLVSACLPVVVHLAVSVVNPVSTAITFGWLSVCRSVRVCVCVCVFAPPSDCPSTAAAILCQSPESAG